METNAHAEAGGARRPSGAGPRWGVRFALLLCPLRDLGRAVRADGATHVLSLVEPDGFRRPRGVIGHLVVPMADTEDPRDDGAPLREDMARILEFGRSLPDGAVLAVHCEAGVSRSGAAALGLLVQETGDVDEAVAVLRRLRPQACPNGLLLAHADRLLGCGGRLLARLPEIRAAADDWHAARLGG